MTMKCTTNNPVLHNGKLAEDESQTLLDTMAT
jgi:hypothetical protein